MARSSPRTLFGIHGVTPYSRTTGLPYGELRVMKSSSVSLQGSQVELSGGSSKYPWAVEEGAIAAEVTLDIGEIEDFMFTLFLGKAPTSVNAETSGNVSAGVNVNGTTVIDASNGISAVSATSADYADLKFGKYTIVATGTNTFDLYISTSLDLGRGTNMTIQSDAMKLNSSALTLSATVVDANSGLTFTKVGTPAFTTGDTAVFWVRPVSSGGMTVVIGGVEDQNFPEFGMIIYGQKRGNQEMVELDCYRCKAAGMPLPFDMGAFPAYQVKVKLLYDDVQDGLFAIRHVKPTGS